MAPSCEPAMAVALLVGEGAGGEGPLPALRIAQPMKCLRRAGGFGRLGRIGAWRSLVARLNGVQKVGGSNPLAPTLATRDGRLVTSLPSAFVIPTSHRDVTGGCDISRDVRDRRREEGDAHLRGQLDRYWPARVCISTMPDKPTFFTLMAHRSGLPSRL